MAAPCLPALPPTSFSLQVAGVDRLAAQVLLKPVHVLEALDTVRGLPRARELVCLTQPTVQ